MTSTRDIDPQAPAVRRFTNPLWQPQAQNLAAVRARIDELDAQLVDLLAQRALCVRDATRFKRDLIQVAAPTRQAEVFTRVRALASAHEAQFPGLGDIAESTWHVLVAGFVAAEGRLLQQTEIIE